MNELGDPQPGGVQDLDQRAISEASRRRDVGLLDEPVDLFDGQKLRQRRPRAWRLEIVSRICGEMLREDGEAVEASHGRDRSRDRARRQAFVHQPVDETFEVVPVQALKRLLERGGEFSKPLEIASVAFEGVIGEAPLDAQVREIRIDEIVGG